MGIIRKASEIEAKKTVSIMIYGQPGVGKTTLGMSAPNPLVFDFDGGYERTNAVHRCDVVCITKWEDLNTAFTEVLNERPDIKTVVIDTVGKMLDYMSEYIIRTEPRLGKSDGTLSLQGYGRRKQMFIDFLGRCTTLGRSVIFIAHEREEKRNEEYFKRPEVGGSSGNDLIKELDLVGYMQMEGKYRTIHFNPTEFFYAKNSCMIPPEGLRVPDLLDKEGMPIAENKLIKQVINACVKERRESIEKSAQLEAMMATLDAAIAGTTDGAGLNEILDSIEAQKPVLNYLVLGRARVAKRGRELGLKTDPLTGRYLADGQKTLTGHNSVNAPEKVPVGPENQSETLL